MLSILFHIGSDRYALDGRDVVEIIPMVRFKELPRAPDYVLGLFMYRGAAVPVLDLCRMAGKPAARPAMSTRILLVNYAAPDGATHILGLVAEKVTDALQVEASSAQPSGVAVKDAPWLGEVDSSAQGLIQRIRVGDLLPAEVRQHLFAEGAAAP